MLKTEFEIQIKPGPFCVAYFFLVSNNERQQVYSYVANEGFDTLEEFEEIAWSKFNGRFNDQVVI